MQGVERAKKGRCGEKVGWSGVRVGEGDARKWAVEVPVR